MPLRDFNPELPDEAREAISAAFDAIADCHNEVAASSEKVVTRIAQAARVLGWPDQVVSAMIDQMQTVTKTQIQMMDHTMEVWREQIKSWPSRSPPDNWLDAEVFKAMSVNTAQFWTRMGEQWQKKLGADDDVAVGGGALKAERRSRITVIIVIADDPAVAGNRWARRCFIGGGWCARHTSRWRCDGG